MAQALSQQRYQHGALNIETIEVRPVLVNDQVTDVVKQDKNRATELIEDFMIAANEVVARTLAKRSLLSAAWSRRQSAGTASFNWLQPREAIFPAQPDSKALNSFLMERKAADPAISPTFPSPLSN